MQSLVYLTVFLVVLVTLQSVSARPRHERRGRNLLKHSCQAIYTNGTTACSTSCPLFASCTPPNEYALTTEVQQKLNEIVGSLSVDPNSLSICFGRDCTATNSCPPGYTCQISREEQDTSRCRPSTHPSPPENDNNDQCRQLFQPPRRH